MHIPDGFLEPKVWAPLALVSGGAVLAASKKVGRGMDESRVPLMGVLAAFVFAAQMVNFPIGGGTSGHIMGGFLIAVLVGPYAALLIMASILILQALLFQDGGITALGANIFNMGIAGTCTGYAVFRAVRFITGNSAVSIFTGAWLSVVAASGAAAVELSLSNVVPLRLSVPAMIVIHSIIGIGEGAITIAAIGLIGRVSKDNLYESAVPARMTFPGKWTWISLAFSGAIAVLAAPFASELPDGLERVAENLGFIDKGRSYINSPMADYHLPGLNGGQSTAVAGIIGVLIAFSGAYVIVKTLHRKGKG